jgi:hypothetical protein
MRLNLTKSGRTQVPRVSSGDPQVLLHPEDNDLMVRTGKQVIEACQLNISIELWKLEFDALCLSVKEWATKSNELARSVLIAPRGGKLALFVSPMGNTFDFDLADSLVQLNTLLAQKFNVGMVEILQIPSEEVDRFVDGSKARVLYGNQAGSHQPVEAQSRVCSVN